MSSVSPCRPAWDTWQALALLVHALVPAWLMDPHLALSPSISITPQVSKFKYLRMGKSAPDMKGISGHRRKK